MRRMPTWVAAAGAGAALAEVDLVGSAVALAVEGLAEAACVMMLGVQNRSATILQIDVLSMWSSVTERSKLPSCSDA